MAVPTADTNARVNIHRDKGYTIQPIADTVILYRHSIVCEDSSDELQAGDDVANYTSPRIVEAQYDNTDDGRSAKLWEGDIELPATAALRADPTGSPAYLTGTVTDGLQEVGDVTEGATGTVLVGRTLERDVSTTGYLWIRVTAEAQQPNI